MLDVAMYKLIEEHAVVGDQQKDISPIVLNIIKQKGWLNMYLPKHANGLALDLPAAVQLIEDIAHADGSTGWFVTLVSGAHWFAGFANPEIKTLFTSVNAVVGGSGATTGTAEWRENGYLINGNWLYATGCLHATALTANCIVYKNGKPMLEDGKPMLRSFIFLKQETILHDTWHAMGMKATGSHSFSASNLLVPHHSAFEILPEKATWQDPVFRLPFYAFAQCTLLPNLTGMVKHFYDLLCNEKKIPHSAEQTYQHFNATAQSFFDEVNLFWQAHLNQTTWHQALLDVSFAKTVEASVHCMQTLYLHAGMQAAQEHTIMNIVWRDFNTAIQHSIFG